jgi:hypothetical protein
MKRTWFNLRRDRRTKPFLLLEIGMVHLRLHEVDASRNPIRVNLIRQESVFSGDASALMEAARTVLDASSEIHDLAIVMNSPSIHHHVVAIPPMNIAEREKIVRMEMKHGISGEGTETISFWPAGKVKENGAIKEYVLCAEMPRATSEALISAARENKFNLIGLTSHPQIVSHLLKECCLDSVSNLALVEVNENEGSITLFHSNIWNMERQFLIGAAIPGIETPATLDMDKLKLEVGRALQYFKQQVRNENISRIFLYGTTNQADQIKSLLEAAFRIPVAPIALDSKIFSVKGQADQLLSIPHAAAIHSHFEAYIDFLPPEWRKQRRNKIRMITVAASVAALYALLCGLSYLFTKEAAQIDKSEKASIQILQRPAEPVEKIQQIQNDRIFALAVEQSADWARRRHIALAGFARELASAMPAEMRITALEANEKENSWIVKLDAEICSPNGSRSQDLFLKFQERIRMQSGLNHLNWSAVQLSDSQSAEGEGSGSKLRNLLTFSMQAAIALNSKI